jgi:hypothetical protein
MPHRHAWVGYSYNTVLDHCRTVHRGKAIGGEPRHGGSREAGQVTVAEAGRVLTHYRWVTLTAEELEEAQEE